MLTTAGPEIMNSITPEINWKSVKKGKRSRKSMARSLKGVAKAGNSSPKRVGDFSGSDSDKIGETVLGKSPSGKAEHVPIKKRRHALGSPDSLSPHLHSTSPLSEDQDQLSYPSRSSGQRSLNANSKWQLRGGDSSAMVKFGKWLDNEALCELTEGEHFESGDFSGIELLANAASMEDADNANKDVPVVEDSSMPKSSDADTATLSKLGLKYNESGNSSSCASEHTENANCSLALNKCEAFRSPSGSVKGGSAPECVSLKVDRRHWDLNTLMDEWDEPYDEHISGNTTQCLSDHDVPIEGRQKRLEDHLQSNLGAMGAEYSILETEETKLNGVIPNGNCMESPSLKMLTTKIYTSPDVGQNKDGKDSPKSSERPDQNDGTCRVGSTTADCQEQSNPDEIVAKSDLADEEPQRIVLEDSCKSCSPGAQCDDPTSSVGKVDSTTDALNESDTSQDNHGLIVDGDDQSRIQEDSDSPSEDGELKGAYCYSWEENELDKDLVDYESDGRNGGGSDVAEFFGSEIVEGGSEGSNGSERRSLIMKRLPEGNGIKSGSIKHSVRRIKDDSEDNEIGGRKESNGGSGTTVEQSMEIVVEENDDGMKRRRHFTDHRNAVDGETLVGEYALTMARGKLQSRVEGRSCLDAPDEKDVSFIEQCRSRGLGGSYSRERDFSPAKHMGSYRPVTHVSERDGVDQWNKWDSRSRYTSGPHGRNHSRPRGVVGDSANRFGGFDFHDQRQTANYPPKGLHRPLVRRRSPMDRDDGFGVRRRMPPTRGIGCHQSRRQYPQGPSRDFGDDFQPMLDATAASDRLPRYFSKMERSFSPSSVRGAHMPSSRRRSRSRSRTRSPKTWHSHRERNFGCRRHSRSPDFRPEARMERMRMPFSKPSFASDYSEGYMSPPPRAQFSPHRNGRFVDSRKFTDNHLRNRRSPIRDFRRTQRFDAVSSSGQFQSDDYFRPMIRSKRFSYMASEDRECKVETNYEDRKREDIGEMMHRRRQSDDGSNTRRFRHDVGHDFETSNTNNEDDVRGTLPQGQNEREDKKAVQV